MAEDKRVDVGCEPRTLVVTEVFKEVTLVVDGDRDS